MALGAAIALAGCVNPNRGLVLPQQAGPVPVSAPHELTAAEKDYWEQLAPAKVIYIGETHNSNSDHEYQWDVLKGLHAQGVRFAIGWEMFDETEQPLLDTWQARKLTSDSLLEKTAFQAHWGVLSVMYEKILRWSLAEGVPSVALNAPAAMSHQIAQGQPLDPAERAMLPTGYHPLPGGFEHFSEQMAENPHGGADVKNLYAAQLLWDQTMATRIADFLSAHPDEKLVVLIGRGHVEGGFGVPAFVRQRTDAQQLIIYPGNQPPGEPGTGGRLAVEVGSRAEGVNHSAATSAGG